MKRHSYRKMKNWTSKNLLTIVLLVFCCTSSAKSKYGYVIATDYMKADGKTDVTESLQKLIDQNPNRTIFLPDGVYNISRSILTPADPKKSVTLILSNYARLQAVGEWKEGGAVVRLGASHPANDIRTPGSNYQFTGGIVDGGNVADGISIDGGRETKITNVSIKHTRIGIHIKHGANGGSSDADVENVNVVGNDQPDAIGVLLEGYDNTLTNMRIASVNVGVWIKSGGNSLRNIHPLYIFAETQNYESSIGFRIDGNVNWLTFCYSDQMATGYKLAKGITANFTDCFCYWYSGKVPFQTAFDCEGTFESLVTGFRTGFHHECKKHTLIKADKGGRGKLVYPNLQDTPLSDEDVSMWYIGQ